MHNAAIVVTAKFPFKIPLFHQILVKIKFLVERSIPVIYSSSTHSVSFLLFLYLRPLLTFN